MDKRNLGKRYEEKAAAWLKRKGYKVLQLNYRCKAGEADIVALHKDYIVFVEVKMRRSLKYGRPEEAVDFRKQQRLKNIAKHFLFEKGMDLDRPVRFDVVAFTGDYIKVYENAF